MLEILAQAPAKADVAVCLQYPLALPAYHLRCGVQAEAALEQDVVNGQELWPQADRMLSKQLQQQQAVSTESVQLVQLAVEDVVEYNLEQILVMSLILQQIQQ
jgi:hypothetical protein